MAKSKRKEPKTPKKRSTKYGKLAAVCSKELSTKKAALVRAEKALAKAQQSHTELLSEVARLDMLDRSLKALINGTEPPQNVRYVYTYPQWVWYGNPYGWYWNSNTWTLNMGQTVNTPNYSIYNGNFQGGQFQNAINTVTAPSGAGLTSTTSGAITSNVFTVNNASSGSGLSYNASGIALDTSGMTPAGAAPAPTTWTYTTSAGSQQVELTVDLSTGAIDENGTIEDDGVCPECGVETLEEGVPLSHKVYCSKLKTEAESIEVVSKVTKVGHGG